MIETALQVMERLGYLLTLDESVQEPRLAQLIEPLYRDTERLVQDYTLLYMDLIAQLYTHDDVSAVIKWLEVQRMELIPLRVKVQTFMAKSRPGQCNGNSAIGKFQHGIMSLIQGCVSFVKEDCERFDAYRYNGPMVLDQLYAKSQDPLPLHRTLYVNTAKKQFQALERVWEDAVEGYAAIKFHCHQHKGVQEAPLSSQS